MSDGDLADTVVQAAGGLVLRDGPNGSLEIALVHRPRYDDWTLPKGKLMPGESYEDGALREVQEETGLRCRLDRFLDSVSYLDRSGKTKVVRYWLMEPIDGEFAPGDEVDAMRWVSPADAVPELSYDHDKELLRAFLDGGSGDAQDAVGVSTVYLVRHAKAGTRERWIGPDHLRPLTRRGRKQARRLVKELDELTIRRLISSPAARCVQTLEPLATALGLPVEVAAALAEDGDLDRTMRLIAEWPDTVLCTHRELIDGVLAGLAAAAVPLGPDLPRQKGSIWVLRVESGRVASARYLPPPTPPA